jgi:hypothetical protein
LVPRSEDLLFAPPFSIADFKWGEVGPQERS